MLFFAFSPDLLNWTSFGADVILVLLFGAGFPWLLHKIFNEVPYLKDVKDLKLIGWGMSGMLLLLAITDLISILFGYGYSGDIWLKAIGSFFGLALFIVGSLRWPWLNTLYPKETLLMERKRNAQLIRKQMMIDEVNPSAKFESRNGVIIDANLAATKLTGYTRHELNGMNGRKLFHPEDQHFFEEIVLRKKTEIYECRILHKTHSEENPRAIPVEVHSVELSLGMELRVTFLTDMTKYVEERDRRLREAKVNSMHTQLIQSAQDLQATASQL